MGRHRRAQRALERQLLYQQEKAKRIRADERTIFTMKQQAANVRALLDTMRPISSEARILEVGSGAHGHVFFFDAAHKIAVDPLAQSYVKLFPMWQRQATTVAAFGESLPFRESSFDIVLSDNVVDHAESPVKILSEIARVLKPSGLFYFTVNIHHPIYAVASQIHAAWNDVGIKYEIDPFADHTVHLTFNSARKLFAGLPLRILLEMNSIDQAKTTAKRRAPHTATDRLKRLFFKNAVYEVVAIREN